MNNAAVIAKRESLLERVRSRASRTPSLAPVARMAALPLVEDDALPTRPPPAPTPEIDISVDIDVQEATDVVVDLLADDGGAPESSGSRERLVAANPLLAEPALELPSEPVPLESDPVAIGAHADAPTVSGLDELTVSEPGDEAPASSRRPLVVEPEERLANLAFTDDEPRPLIHTPPPESGRLRAAPPVVEFDGDVTGVRAQPAVRPDAELVPEPTTVELAASEAVADVIGTSSSLCANDIRGVARCESRALSVMTCKGPLCSAFFKYRVSGNIVTRKRS